MKGVELALEGADGPLLVLSSEGGNEGFVGVLVISDDESGSTPAALSAFSMVAGLNVLVCLRFRFFTTRARDAAAVVSAALRF